MWCALVYVWAVGAAGAAGAAVGAAGLTLLGLEAADDLHSVGSYVREVRAAPPSYHHSYENEGDGEVGFVRRRDGGGKKGYQHFDSYHKKAGDNYEFEKQDSYGDEDEGADAAHSHRSERRARPERPGRQRRRSAEDDDVEQVDKEDGDHSYYEQLSELKQGEGDGNGGTEAYGHVAADYVLPERYTYPGDDEE